MILCAPRKKYNAQNCNLVMNNEPISRVDRITFLGVIIDENMSWDYHFNHLTNKLAKTIGILLRARRLLYRQTLYMLYNSIIKPHLIYGITVWGNTHKKNLHKIHLMQKRIIRIITFSEFCAHTAPIFKKTNIMSIYNLQIYSTGLFIFKCLRGFYPIYFAELFQRNMTNRTEYNLRSIFCRTQFSQFSIKSAGPRLWNQLPANIKKSKILHQFKIMMKRYLKID